MAVRNDGAALVQARMRESMRGGAAPAARGATRFMELSAAFSQKTSAFSRQAP
jgi:hypothetical protein